MAFFFLTFLFDNGMVLVAVLCIATIRITIYIGFNRLYVWQIVSFRVKIIVLKHEELIDKVYKNILGVLLLVASAIMVVLKKT